MDYGGVLIVFCGEFFQIPPVHGSSVFINPDSNRRHCSVLYFSGYDPWN